MSKMRNDGGHADVGLAAVGRHRKEARLIDRLPWKQDDQPKHFVAVMPEGTAKVWWKERDVSPPRLVLPDRVRQDDPARP
jgi:hypothetical protein